MGAADRIADTILRLGQIQGDALNRTGDIAARAQALAAAARAQGVTGSADALARATAANGQVWGQTLQSLGQLPGQIVAQQRQQKTTDLENTQRQQQIDATTAAQKGQAQANAVVAALPKNPDGTFDPTTLQQQLSEKNVPLAQQEGLLKSIDSVNGVIKGFNQSKQDHIADLANSILSLHGKDDPVTADAVHLGLAAAQHAGLATSDDVDRVNQAIDAGADPSAVLQQFRKLGSKYAAEKPVVIPRGGTLATEAGQVLATGQPEPKTEAEIAFEAAKGDPSAAMSLLKPAPKEPANEFSTFQNAYASSVAGIGKKWSDLDPATQLAGINKFKTMTTDASALAAANRQADALQHSNDLQTRGQDFQQKEAGRKELTEKVEQPYQDAVEKASTLRSVIDAAKNGNMAAGSVQSLLGTLGLVTMEGVKRINSTELNQAQGAGSLLERIKGQVGGLVAGKPMSPKLQQDLADLSKLLEQSARTKYEGGFNQVTKRYGLTDETMLPEASGSTRGSFTVKDPTGKVHAFETQAQVDAFKKLAGL